MRFYTEKFIYIKESKCFSAEISDLCLIGKNPFHNLLDVKYNSGITLISTRTNKETDWYIKTIHYKDNSITHWTLLPIDNAIRRHPQLEDHKLIIWNT